METARGTVSNCQHTFQVSGGANNTSTSTAYITLFRVDGRQVRFRSSQPSSVSEGDSVAVAGLMWRGSLDALAIRNLTTGEIADAGVWGYVFGAGLLSTVGIIVLVAMGQPLGLLMQFLIAGVAVAIAIYLIYRAELTWRAVRMVSG